MATFSTRPQDPRPNLSLRKCLMAASSRSLTHRVGLLTKGEEEEVVNEGAREEHEGATTMKEEGRRRMDEEANENEEEKGK